MKKIGEFLKKLNSHTIYVEPDLSKEFEAETGFKACWPTHTVGRTSCQDGPKGVVKLSGQDHELCSYGYEIAESLEEVYAKTTESARFNGRGSSFRAALKSIESKGL